MTYAEARPYTTKLLDMIDNDMISKEFVIQDLLGWLSEEEVKQFMIRLDYISDVDNYDESMDGDFDSAMASAGFGTDEDYGYNGE